MTRELTPELLAASQRGLQRLFLNLYNQVELGRWADLFTRVSSTSAGENYPALGAAPGMAKFEGTRVYGGVRTDGFYVLNEEFDAGFEIPRVDIERDRLGVYNDKVAQMAQNARTYVLTLIGAILANATSTSLAKCWDNKALISATHGKDKGSQSNIISGSGVDTVDHVQTDIEQVLAAAAQVKDDKGNYVQGIVPNVAIVPAANYTLVKLLRTIQANRGALGTPDQSGILQDVISTPYLSGNSWYLAVAGGPRRPFGFQEEKPPTPESTYDFDRKVMKFAVEMRGAAFCANWDCIWQVYHA